MLAYIDPGSGSLIFQMLIAGLMGTSFFFRKNFSPALKYVVRLFRREKKPSND